MSPKKVNILNLAELLKFVPPNQIEKFDVFCEKTNEYRRRAYKYPEKLPEIDWEYYEKNVRPEFVKMVKTFQVKCEELNHSFAKRHEALDHSKYFTEWEKINTQNENEVRKFIEDSKRRIHEYEGEIRRIKSFRYDQMTMEEYIDARPEMDEFIPGRNKPLFWPHTPEEQLGYVPDPAEEGDEATKKSKI